MLLKKPMYSRTMSANRDFDNLKATMEIVETMTAEEITALLTQLAAVPKGEKDKINLEWGKKVHVDVQGAP